MEPHDQLIFVLIVGLVFGLMMRASERGRRQDREQNAAWWRRYRERERVTDLQHAWRARFVRYPHESEDEYVARFKSWLYDD